jgi:hypothetical protein
VTPKSLRTVLDAFSAKRKLTLIDSSTEYLRVKEKRMVRVVDLKGQRPQKFLLGEQRGNKRQGHWHAIFQFSITETQ